MNIPMLRLPTLAALCSLLLASCAETPLDQAVYDNFMLYSVAPEEWDDKLDETRADRLQERLTFLRQVLIKIEAEHRTYALRCNPLQDLHSSSCQSAEDLQRVITSLQEIEASQRSGSHLRGSLTERLSFGLSEARADERARLAKRVRKHFFPEPTESTE